MGKYDKIKLTMEEKKKMTEDIVYFFEEERDEKLGIIASEAILDFFIQTLGETIYNKALDDALLWFKRNFENLEGDYYSIYK